MNFQEWISKSTSLIPDPTLRAQVTSALNLASTIPEFTSHADRTLLLQKDYSRVIEEVRIEKEAQERAIAAERAELEAAKLAAQQQLSTAEAFRAQLADYERVHNRLVELDVLGMVGLEDITPPQPIPNKEDNDMSQFTEQEVAAMKQWIATLPPPGAVPSAPTPEPTPQFLRQEDLAQHLQNVVAASTIGAAAITEAANEYTRLAGKPVSVVEHTYNWQQSGKPLDEYIETTFNLTELRRVAELDSMRASLREELQKEFDAKMASTVFGVGAASPANPTNVPLFNLINEPPSHARKPINPASPPSPPLAEGATPPPAPANSPSALDGIAAAAANLAAGTYAGQRFDVSRPMA